MPLELNDVFVTPDRSIDIDDVYEYDDLSAEGEQLVVSPVRIKGQIRNTGGLVELGYKAEFSYSKPCDRCLAIAEKVFRQDFVHTLALSAENEDTDDIIIVAGYTLDLFSLVRDDILLELPIKHLCSEDCLGLCPKCGHNLNEGSCGCKKEAVDPRMAVLDELLQD